MGCACQVENAEKITVAHNRRVGNAYEILRENLKRLLVGKKQEAVATLARSKGHNLTQSYISGIATGKDQNPTLETLEALAVGLEVRLEELLQRKNVIELVHKRMYPGRTPTEKHVHEQIQDILEVGGLARKAIIANAEVMHQLIEPKLAHKRKGKKSALG